VKINPNAQETHLVSINLLKSLRSFYTVMLQHQILTTLAYFSTSGQNNIITSAVA